MRLRSMLFLLTLVLALSLVMSAQEITGQIRGTVTDSTGAVVPNASVTVTNTDRNQVVRTLHTGPAGEYVAPLLPVGTYSVAVAANGFRTFLRKDIVLNVSDRLTIDASLAPGSGTETVSVVENAAQVNTDTASVEGLIEGAQMRELPLNNRNYEQLVTLQPGVTSNAADQIYVGTTNPSGQVNTVSFSINGQRNSQNNWTIDGADNLDHGSNITLLVYPSVDAISEFKVERSSYSPEFGRSSAGQINVVTRSGGSAFHGSLYEFFRNDALNANIPYNKRVGLPRKVLRYNDFGGTIGGPVYIPGVYNEKKDKTFFFFSEEARRVTTPVTQSTDFPTDPMLAGNFTSTVCTAINAAGDCIGTGTSIPTSQWNPIAAAYIKDIYSKIPSMAGIIRNGSRVTASQSGVFNYREELYRLDHVLTSKIALMGRFINDVIPTQEPFGLFGPQANLPGVGNTKTNSPGQQLMGRATFQISERLYNELGYAYSYGAITSDPTGLAARSKSPDVASAVKLPYAVTLDRIPSVVFDDFSGGTIGSFGQYRDFNRNHNLFDNFSWTKGHHAMKFGMSFNHYQKVENAAGNNAGTYEFDSSNAGSGTSAFEQDWANFLLGYANSSFQQSSADFNADIRQNLWEFYAQDQWRVRQNLTVSYGVRYSYFQTPWAAGNNLISFDPSQYNAANAPQITAKGMIVPGTGNGTNGYIVGGVNSPYGKFITKQNKLDFAPRLGIVWDPTGKGKTSVRAGYGLFYDSIAAGLIEDNIFNNAGDANLGAFISNPNVAGAGSLPMSIYGTDPNWKSPYTESWNVDIQKEFGKGWIVDVGYVGSNSKHLPGVIDINQVKPGIAKAAGLLTGSNVNANGIYKGTTALGEALNAYRPYVGFMQIGEISPIFKANYNALQTSVKKQFGANTTFGAFYTWGKSLTNNQTDRSSGTMYTYCVQCEYGRTTLDRLHVLTANVVYDTPWFKNQKGVAGHILGGWEASSILTVNSGLPLTVLGSAATAGDPMASGYYAPGPVGYGRVASIRPNQIADPNANAPHTWTQWFNTAAFAYQTVSGEVPTEHRGAVNGPGLWRVDMAMLKNMRLAEKVNMQFRVESFNLLNHVNPTTVGTTFGSSTFGKITGTRDGRTVQLGAKILF
jgi:hypothetical protein